MPVAVSGLVGAVVGARLLAVLVDPAQTWASWDEPAVWLGQKTVIGGILGGWLAVEWAKARTGTVGSVGDRYTLPLVRAMAVGRLGCFFSGVTDRTHGLPTNGPLGMDLGDGLLRHPLALYELVVLLLLHGLLARGPRGVLQRGGIPALSAAHRWRAFVVAYLGWRLVSAPLAGRPATVGPFTTLQVASSVGIIWAVAGLLRRR